LLFKEIEVSFITNFIIIFIEKNKKAQAWTCMHGIVCNPMWKNYMKVMFSLLTKIYIVHFYGTKNFKLTKYFWILILRLYGSESEAEASRERVNGSNLLFHLPYSSFITIHFCEIFSNFFCIEIFVIFRVWILWQSRRPLRTCSPSSCSLKDQADKSYKAVLSHGLGSQVLGLRNTSTSWQWKSFECFQI
jgi:hypothetical protein